MWKWGAMDGEGMSDITVGFVRLGSDGRAGWDSRTARADMAGTVAMIDLRLPCPPARGALCRYLSATTRMVTYERGERERRGLELVAPWPESPHSPLSHGVL